MNILHTETLKRWGGQQNRVLSESIGLSKRGHKVVIACNKGSMLAQKAEALGIRVYELDMGKRSHLKTIPALIRIIKREDIDIVCTHSSVDSWAGAIAAWFTGKRLIRFRHNIYPIGRNPLSRFIYSLPDRLIAISDAVKERMIESGVNRDVINVIYSTVDCERFVPDVKDIKEKLGILPDKIVLGNTSTFTGVKGQEFLFKAFNKIYRDCSCLVLFAGRLNESSRERYLQYIDKGLRDRVIFLGHREDVPSVLKTIDIFIYPSFVEGLGTALLEAMAMERPVVVSDIPTFREFIVDGENGLFFKAKDHEDMTKKVCFLIHNKELRERLGRNARRTILERFTIERMLDKTEALYREVMFASANQTRPK